MDDRIPEVVSPSMGSVQEPPARKRRGCFFYGCLTTNLLIAAFVGGLIFVFYYGKANITPVVEEFLTAAEWGNYDRAYAMLADEWKAKTSREEFPALFKLVHNSLGARRSLSMRGIKLFATPAGTVAQAEYAATYDNGDAELKFSLRKDGGKWMISGLFYNSSKLANALKCANCGAVNTPEAKFCAKCGKPLQQVQAEKQN